MIHIYFGKTCLGRPCGRRWGTTNKTVAVEKGHDGELGERHKEKLDRDRLESWGRTWWIIEGKTLRKVRHGKAE